MKTLKLLSLALQNFKGQTFELIVNGRNATVYGDNGTGKTTIYDALCWLLFDKDSAFKSAFEIKNINESGESQHNLTHEVKGLFNLDGKVVELRKVYAEIWTKKRGSTSKEMTGHTTDYFIDAVPVQKKEYQQRISEIATEEEFKLLTNPFYFSSVMKWQDRRSLLLRLCGDVSDEQVIAGNAELLPLRDVLQGRKIEEHKRIVAARRKEINDQLATIPARIDETARAIESCVGINHLAEIEKINKLSAEVEKVNTAIADLKDTGGVADLRRRIVDAETAKQRVWNEVEKGLNSLRAEKDSQLRMIQAGIDDKRRSISEKNRDLVFLRESSAALTEKISVLRDEWKVIDEQQKAFSASSNCPTCGHELSDEQKQQAIANNNEAAAKEKALINSKGKAASQQLEDTQKKICDINESLFIAANLEKELACELSREQGKLIEPDVDDKKYIADLDEVIKNIAEKLKEAESGVVDNGAVFAAEQKAVELRMQISQAQAKVATVEAAQQSADRKKELEAEQRKLAAEFEKLESDLFLMDSFTRAKVEMLEGRINSMFSLARFKMFETQINGGLAECCSVTYRGIPFETSLNNGARIQVGLDIIKTISGSSGLSLFVVIDNNESVTALPEMDCQLIGMFVSENDKTLRVEVQE